MDKILISTTSFGQYDPEPLEILKKHGFEPIMNPTGKTMKAEEGAAVQSFEKMLPMIRSDIKRKKVAEAFAYRRILFYR